MYEMFAQVYDKVFPMNKATAHFLNTKLPDGLVLDLACGTGSYALELANAKRQVIGNDLDENMIRIANEKKQDQSVLFDVRNMLELDKANAFDGIYMIGNSLVHLEDEDSIFAMLNRVYKALKPKGTFILQIINYDRILDQNIKGLPTIKSEGVIFERHYDYKAPHIDFHTLLHDQDNIIESTVKLFPIRYHVLIAMLEEVGFHVQSTYGGFDETPFSLETSVPLIIHAKKQ